MAPKGPECQYSYKPCSNPRSIKRNGTLHLLCEFHRKKANAIQREYARKKRLRKLMQSKFNTTLENAIEQLSPIEDPLAVPEWLGMEFLDQLLLEA